MVPLWYIGNNNSKLIIFNRTPEIIFFSYLQKERDKERDCLPLISETFCQRQVVHRSGTVRTESSIEVFYISNTFLLGGMSWVPTSDVTAVSGLSPQGYTPTAQDTVAFLDKSFTHLVRLCDYDNHKCVM